MSEARPFVALGIDFNTERADVAVLIGREVREEYLAWRLAELHYPKGRKPKDEIPNHGLYLDERLRLLADSFASWWQETFHALEPDVCYLERPRGKFAQMQMNMFYGALFVALRTRFPVLELWGIEPQQWRKQLDLPLSLPKEVSIAIANERFVSAAGEPGDFNEHEAEALLMANACLEDQILGREF